MVWLVVCGWFFKREGCSREPKFSSNKPPSAKTPMTEYQISNRIASRAFVVASYHPNSEGILRPDCPMVGPCRSIEDRCRIFFHHYRKRKTGPRFPIAVCGCKSHGGHFTIYPPGFGPFVRQKVAPVDHTGEVTEPDPEAESFSGTYFQSSLDLAIGLRWDTWDSAQGVALTQRRQIERSCHLLAIASCATASEQAAVADRLSIPVLHIRDQRQVNLKDRSLQAKSNSVRALLRRLNLRRVSGWAIASAHHLAGIWGPPHFWDPRAGRMTLR